MSTFLTLNGISIPCTAADAVPVRAGEVERTANLSLRSDVRASAWDLPCATGLLSQEEARAVVALVHGEGHALSFADTTTATSFLWSSRGLVPSDTGGTVARATGGRWASRLRLLYDAEVRWAFELGSEWTVAFWFRHDAYPTWKHYLVRSDGGVWVNGVASSSPTPAPGSLMAVEPDGSLYLSTGGELGDGYSDYSEVLALPYAVPDTWAPLLYAFTNARAWAPLPFLLAQGAAVPGGESEVQGRVGIVERTLGGPGTWLESFDFTLFAEP